MSLYIIIGAMASLETSFKDCFISVSQKIVFNQRWSYVSPFSNLRIASEAFKLNLSKEDSINLSIFYTFRALNTVPILTFIIN